MVLIYDDLSNNARIRYGEFEKVLSFKFKSGILVTSFRLGFVGGFGAFSRILENLGVDLLPRHFVVSVTRSPDIRDYLV